MIHALEQDVAAAEIYLLETRDTPAAHAALRRFVTSKAGDDEPQRLVLLALHRCGEIETGEAVRIWYEGAQEEIQPRTFGIIENDERDYEQPVIDRLNREVIAMREDRLDDAERFSERPSSVTRQPRKPTTICQPFTPCRTDMWTPVRYCAVPLRPIPTTL